MSSKAISILWKLTGLVAVGLLLATISLVLRYREYANVEVKAYTSGPVASIYLREKPSDQSKIVTVIPRGTPVTIIGSFSQEDQTWYQVKSGDHAGWMAANHISLTPP